jgi:hypothetical protein
MSLLKTETNIHFLSKLLKEGACLRCMNNSCKFEHKNNVSYPNIICKFVKNPTLINGVTQMLMNANLDFKGKEVYYTICNYVNGKCNNCEQNRKKKILINNNSQFFYVCYPDLNDSRTKITVGIHFDIQLLLNADESFKVSILPYPLDDNQDNNHNQKKALRVKKRDDRTLSSLDLGEDNQNKTDLETCNETVDFMTNLKQNFYEKQNKKKNYVQNIFEHLDEEKEEELEKKQEKNVEYREKKQHLFHSKSGNFLHNERKSTDLVIQCLETDTLDYADDNKWPSFGSPVEVSRPIHRSPSIDYSKIKKSFENEVDVTINTGTNSVTLDINDNFERRNIKVNLPKSSNVTCSYNVSDSKSNRLTSPLPLKCGECSECKELIKLVVSLKTKISCLEDDLRNERIHSQNKEVYSEILYNVRELNSRVTEQFMETEYADYDFY